MLRRLYVHNFRCLQNFELRMEYPSILLIGNNGSGKTTVAFALQLLQQIARGKNRVGELVDPKDLPPGDEAAPMRFEIEVEISGRRYTYGLALEYPRGFKELRVLQEKLTVDTQIVFSRDLAQVQVARDGQNHGAEFRIDWHLVSLPIIQQQSDKDPLSIFKTWLSRVLVLRPIPSLIDGESTEQTLEPNTDVKNLAAWLTGLLTQFPAVYATITNYLQQMMPDLQQLRNPLVAKNSRSLEIDFSGNGKLLSLNLGDLSDGEKCFIVSAAALAANEATGPLLCFWDEPDNYLAISEVGHLILALRRSFQLRGQLIVTSHNPEAIRSFADDNTFVLFRKSHLEPTRILPLAEANVEGDLIDALIRGDVEP